MNVFLMHIGSPGNIDVEYTISKKRTRAEMLGSLPPGSVEEPYFRSDPTFMKAFPSGEFNCWGVSPKALPRIKETQIGDLVLFFPTAGQNNGALEYIGVVKAKAEMECWEASKILWPKTPHQRPFPFIFFFDSEAGNQYWLDFLVDIGYSPDWDPRGYYRRIGDRRFLKWGGPGGYLAYLRNQLGFSRI